MESTKLAQYSTFKTGKKTKSIEDVCCLSFLIQFYLAFLLDTCMSLLYCSFPPLFYQLAVEFQSAYSQEYILRSDLRKRG